MWEFYIAFFLVAIALIVIDYLRAKSRLPPGPCGLPVLGYLPWIDPEAPHKTLTALARKYGPICGLRMGSVYTVIVSDPRLIRQALAKDSCSGRAPLYVTHGIMQGYGLICAEGDLWRDQRRFVAACLKKFGMVKFGAKRDKMEERILAAVEESILMLKTHSGEQNMNPQETLHHCMGNFLNSLVFGKVYEEHDKTWKWLQHLQEDGVKHIGVAGPLNFLPFLRFLPRFKKMMHFLIDGKLKTHDVYREIIKEHQEHGTHGDSILAEFHEELKERETTGEDIGHFTDSQYVHLLADIFGAGTDTTLTTLRWLLLYMAVYPHEQEKVHEEMDSVLGTRHMRLEDRSDLPYLEAAISEVQRIRSVVPVGIPHGTTEECQIGDYTIPKGTMVVPLQWAVHMDPLHWPEPEEYRPGRFIAENGSLTKPEAFIPFQNGKRMCVGEELAKMLLFLFAGRILQTFTISLPEGVSGDLSGDCGITLTPKPHRLLFKARF